MNTKTSQMQIRLDPELKSEAEDVLTKLGLSSTEFVRMALRQLVMRKGLPFEARIPNKETIAAFNENLENLPRFTNAAELFKYLDSQVDEED